MVQIALNFATLQFMILTNNLPHFYTMCRLVAWIPEANKIRGACEPPGNMLSTVSDIDKGIIAL